MMLSVSKKEWKKIQKKAAEIFGLEFSDDVFMLEDLNNFNTSSRLYYENVNEANVSAVFGGCIDPSRSGACRILCEIGDVICKPENGFYFEINKKY